MSQTPKEPFPIFAKATIWKILLLLSVLTAWAVLLCPFIAEAASPTDEALIVAFISDSNYGIGFEQVLSLIQSEGASAVVHLGDFDANDDPAGFFAVINSILGEDFPYFLAVGNHDAASWPGDCGNPSGCYSDELSRRLTALGITPDDPDLNDGVYSITYRGLKLVFVGQDGSLGDSTYAPYINSQLEGDDHLWKICGWHRNQAEMQISDKENEMGWGVYEACREQGAIIATAHAHAYARTKTLTDMSLRLVYSEWSDPHDLLVAPGATFAFVSGPAGASITPQKRCFPATYPYGCNGEWARIYSATQFAQHGALFITFNVGGDPYQAHGVFKNISGEIIDEFDITASSDPVEVPTPRQPLKDRYIECILMPAVMIITMAVPVCLRSMAAQSSHESER